MIYKKGNDNPADFLSRHPQPKVPKCSIAEEYVNFVTVNAAEAAIPLEVIKERTSNDSALMAVQKAVQSGAWTDKLVKPFLNVKDEIAVDNKNGVVLRGTRIIIPVTLQKRIVKLAHTGHQGLAKTKALLRQYAWFPNMDKAVKQEIETCLSTKLTDPRTLQNRYERQTCQMDRSKPYTLIFMAHFPPDSMLSFSLTSILGIQRRR